MNEDKKIKNQEAYDIVLSDFEDWLKQCTLEPKQLTFLKAKIQTDELHYDDPEKHILFTLMAYWQALLPQKDEDYDLTLSKLEGWLKQHIPDPRLLLSLRVKIQFNDRLDDPEKHFLTTLLVYGQLLFRKETEE